jgi:hypothetical protein
MHQKKIVESEKTERIIAFLHELDRAIKNNLPFSFTGRAHANKVNWDPHALKIRAIMIDQEYVVENGAKNAFQWGQKLRNPQVPMETIAGLVLNKMKQAKELHDYPMGRPGDDLTEEITELGENSKEKEGEQEPFSRPPMHPLTSYPLSQVPTAENGVLGGEEAAQEEGQLDEIEWAVIKHALSKMIASEQSGTYKDLAQKVYDKL